MTTPAAERFPPGVRQLLSTATRIIDEQLNEQGLSAICGSVWPCERAMGAEHNLAGF